jgi:hypothetical protein
MDGILKWVLKAGWNGMDWIHLAQDKNKWQGLVNMVMTELTKCREFLEKTSRCVS